MCTAQHISVSQLAGGHAGLHGLGIESLTCRWDEVTASNLVGLDKVRGFKLSACLSSLQGGACSACAPASPFCSYELAQLFESLTTAGLASSFGMFIMFICDSRSASRSGRHTLP